MNVSNRVFWAGVALACSCIVSAGLGAQSASSGPKFTGKTAVFDNLVAKSIFVGSGAQKCLIYADQGETRFMISNGSRSIKFFLDDRGPEIELSRDGKTGKRISLDTLPGE